jgi:hypothetical protein
MAGKNCNLVRFRQKSIAPVLQKDWQPRSGNVVSRNTSNAVSLPTRQLEHAAPAQTSAATALALERHKPRHHPMVAIIVLQMTLMKQSIEQPFSPHDSACMIVQPADISSLAVSTSHLSDDAISHLIWVRQDKAEGV